MSWPTTSRQSRGYDAAWDKTRLRILARDNGLCQCDQCKGGKVRITQGTEVHHIVSKAAAKRIGWTPQQTEDDNNLQCVNTECHKRITQEENGATYKPKVQIGADGWPISSNY